MCLMILEMITAYGLIAIANIVLWFDICFMGFYPNKSRVDVGKGGGMLPPSCFRLVGCCSPALHPLGYNYSKVFAKPPNFRTHWQTFGSIGSVYGISKKAVSTFPQSPEVIEQALKPTQTRVLEIFTP